MILNLYVYNLETHIGNINVLAQNVNNCYDKHRNDLYFNIEGSCCITFTWSIKG